MTKTAVAGLRANHDDLQAILESIGPDEWTKPSACAGWRVQDVLAHVTSNFKEMIDPTPTPGDPQPAMTAEVAMEALVAPRKDWTPQQLLDEYAQFKESVFAALGGMQEEPMASTEIPLADLGIYQMHWLANAYCFDHYCHLRHDLLAPAGPVANRLAPADDARVRPGIDWMIAGIPQMCGDAMRLVQRPFRIELTGPGAGTWTIHPSATSDGLVTLVEERGEAVATVKSTAHDFVSWGTKRSDWRTTCTLHGDTEYATSVLDALNIV
jgi:uncharacterized protein (TIGR03083 family)